MKLLIFSLLVWGSFVIGQSKIFEGWRDFLDKLPWDWPAYLWDCPTCYGFWASIFWTLVTSSEPYIAPVMEVSNWLDLLEIGLYLMTNGVIGSALCTLLEVGFRYLNDKLSKPL